MIHFEKNNAWAPRLRTLAAAGLLALASVQASASLITARSSVGGTGMLSWGQLGADGSDVTPLPATVSSSLGVGAMVDASGGLLMRFDEGAGSWAGNFAPGDALLTNFFAPGTISIDFDAGVSRVGAQLMAFDIGAFTGHISVYNAANVLLETHSLGGMSSFDGDNSALFIGVSRTVADIDRVEFFISGSAQGNLDFGLNQVSLSQEVIVVPEPATAALVLLALAGAGAAQRRVRTRAA